MAEFKFCLKSAIASILLICLMQIHIGSMTIEQHAEEWMETSPMVSYLDKVASGGALAARNAGRYLANLTHQTLPATEPTAARASRMDFEIHRNPAAIKPSKNSDNY